MQSYLDYNATTPLRAEVREAMVAAMGVPANPSSVHGFGQEALRALTTAREQVAASIGAMPEQVIFTSGGTEANALALNGVDSERLAVSAIEHRAVLDNAPHAHRLPVNADGQIDCTAVEDWLNSNSGSDARQGGDLRLAVMLANNETGVVQPIEAVVGLAQKYGARVHCDAVQALGKMPIDFNRMGVASMAVSAHKIGGPAGIGALIIKEGHRLTPLIFGGGQEKNRRAGTENLLGAVGFGIAATLASPADFTQHCRPLQKRLESRLTTAAPDAVVFGQNAPRLANTTAIAMPHRSAETQVIALDLAGVAVSAGAACSSGKVQTSHVLAAMGAGGLAGSAIRISTGWNTTDDDINRLAEAWIEFYNTTTTNPTI